jgi:O-succinylbenzoic acid--CoA ligase
VAETRKLVALRGAGADLARRIERVRTAGDAALPIDPNLPGADLARLLDAARPDRMEGPDGTDEPVPPDPPGVDDAVALVVPTSGTSGEPKAVELSAAAMDASARASLARIGSEPADRWLCCVPLQYIAGLAVLERARVAGVDAIVYDRFDVDAVNRERGVTLVSLVPTMLARLLHAGADVSRFRVILLGGGPVAESLLRRARDAGARVVVTYGMTETCGGCVYDGVPLDGVEAEVDAGGAIRLRGPMLMERYRLRPDATAAVLRDGWFRTSDAGELDRSGRLRVLGRLDDLIVTGGKKVAPAEVAAALAEHPGLADVAVCGVPDVEWGERVVAIVVPRGQPPSVADLRSWLGDKIASYKMPRALVAVEAIPRDERGKIGPEALRRLAEGAAE